MKNPIWIEHFGVAVGAIGGALAARGKQLDLFGVVVLAWVTAFGGGSLRDLLLGDLPVFWIRQPELVWTTTAAALATFGWARRRTTPDNTLVVADACALALFTVVGASKAMNFAVAPSIAVAMGVVTGVAGGMLRDVLTGEIPLVFRQQIYLYATASLCGASTFVLLSEFLPSRPWNPVAGILVTLVMRLAAIRWKLALPVFHKEE
ncbi:MAG: trimeric intracellular cation channel family protein [Verrucomicrobia bacterium]|nr:trimeric intracellular cation channel family protein [Verrucomicrobiota bacterium]